MSGIHPGVFIAVSQIRVTFGCSIGNAPKGIEGTGFWLQHGGHDYFITNRHNVDATLKLGSQTTYKLEKLAIQLRRKKPSGKWGHESSLYDVKNLGGLRVHGSADVAIVEDPIFENHKSEYGHSSFTLAELATPAFMENFVNPMDVASFVGFPGKDGHQWWDQKWNLPIARTCHLASWPKIPFTNSSIQTKDVHLVTGLSFSGSSGSPLMLHAKLEAGVATKQEDGTPAQALASVPMRLLGIMSGHWWNEDPATGMFAHSGLSYFTLATPIWELLQGGGKA